MTVSTLLQSNDSPAIEIFNAPYMQTSRIVVICDHASNKVPTALNNLGLTDHKDFEKHVAIDIGAADITRYLSDALNAPAVLAGYSRLVMDLNRDPKHPQSIPHVSDDVTVPANADISDADKKQRYEALYIPYHAAIEDCLKTIRARGEHPFLISIHSFTHQLGDETRDTDIGILWDGNRAIAEKVMDDLKMQHPDMVVGSNDPYSFIDDPDLNHTLKRHEIDRENGYMLVEFRQDLVDTRAKAEKMAAVFLNSLRSVL